MALSGVGGCVRGYKPSLVYICRQIIASPHHTMCSLARATHCRSGHLCSCVMSCVAPTGTKVFINHEMPASEFLRPFVGCTRSFVHYALRVLRAMHWLRLLCVHSRYCLLALLYVYHKSFCCPHTRSSASRLFIARLVDSRAVC